MIRFKRVTVSLLSPMVGIHIGKNPVNGQRFMHVAPAPFIGLDFELGRHREGYFITADLDKDDIATEVRLGRARSKARY